MVDGERLTAAGRQCLLSFEPARKTRQTYSPSALLPAKRPRGDTFFIDGGYYTVEQLSSIDYRSHGTARRATLNPIASALITKMPAPEACMEVLSEHQCQGWLEGYLLTGRHGFFSCYEAFIHIIDSMFNQHDYKAARPIGCGRRNVEPVASRTRGAGEGSCQELCPIRDDGLLGLSCRARQADAA